MPYSSTHRLWGALLRSAPGSSCTSIVIEIQKSNQRPLVSWCQAGKPALQPWRRDTHRKADESALSCGNAPCHCLRGTPQRPRWPAIPHGSPTRTRGRALGYRSAHAWARVSSGARDGQPQLLLLELYTLPNPVANAPPGVEAGVVVKRVVNPPIEPRGGRLLCRFVKGAEGSRCLRRQ